MKKKQNGNKMKSFCFSYIAIMCVYIYTLFKKNNFVNITKIINWSILQADQYSIIKLFLNSLKKIVLLLVVNLIIKHTFNKVQIPLNSI